MSYLCRVPRPQTAARCVHDALATHEMTSQEPVGTHVPKCLFPNFQDEIS